MLKWILTIKIIIQHSSAKLENVLHNQQVDILSFVKCQYYLMLRDHFDKNYDVKTLFHQVGLKFSSQQSGSILSIML